MSSKESVQQKQIKRYKKILEELQEIDDIINAELNKQKKINEHLMKFLDDIQEYHYTITKNCLS